MKVKAKIDLWISLLIWFCIACVTLIPAPLFFISLSAGLSTLMIAGFCDGFLLWIYFGTWYELQDTCLYAVSGPFREKIPYQSIKSLRLCRNLAASMALGLDRIEIRQHGKNYFAGTTMISPADRESFYRKLREKCPELEERIT